jgi:hypothetical protein
MIARGSPMIDGSSVGFDFFVRDPFVFTEGILPWSAYFKHSVWLARAITLRYSYDIAPQSGAMLAEFLT